MLHRRIVAAPRVGHRMVWLQPEVLLSQMRMTTTNQSVMLRISFWKKMKTTTNGRYPNIAGYVVVGVVDGWQAYLM